MKRLFLWFMPVLCLLTHSAKGQDSSCTSSIIQPLQLSLLLRQADDYPGIQALEQTVRQADIDLQLTMQGSLPVFDVQAQNSYGTYAGLAGASFPLPGAYNVTGTDPNSDKAVNLQVSGVLRWDLVQFGKLRNKITAAVLKISSAEKQQELGIWRYKYHLIQSFMELIYSEQMIRWTNKDQQRQQQLIAVSGALAAAGMVAGADTLLTLARYHQSEAEKNRWQGVTAARYSQLKKLIPALSETLPQLPSLLAALPQQASFQPTAETDSKRSPDPKDAHPLIQVKDPAIQLAAVEQEGVSKSVLPSISVLAAGQLRGFAPGAERRQAAYGLGTHNYLAGIAVTWQLAPLYQKNALQKKYQFQKYQLQSEKKVIQLNVQAGRAAAEQQLLQACHQIEQLEQSLKLATQAYQLYQVRYQSGLIDLATLLQVQQTLQEAEKQRLIAYYGYWKYLSAYAAAVNDFSILTRIFH